MRVAVIGAGLAGLAAARSLNVAGNIVKVFEKRSEPGGRVFSIQIGPYLFDPGATTVSPMGKSLEAVLLEELPTDELIKIDKPVLAHDGFRAVLGGLTAASTARYCYRRGIAELPRLLSKGLDLKPDSLIDRIGVQSNGVYLVDSEEFDAVVVALPVPEAEVLLATADDQRKFSNVKFRSCLSVLLGFEAPCHANFHALVGPDQSHPLSWLSIESLKCPGARAPEGHTAIVAQMSAEYSRRRFLSDNDLIVDETLRDVSRLLGKAFESPVTHSVVRFRHSHPETTTSFEAVNSPMSKLVVAGDGLAGGRTEWAYESGLRAAKMLMENQ